MENCRKQRKEHPGFYDVQVRNCAHYVQECLRKCGLPPGSRTPIPTLWFKSYGK
jgi:hypothetical protein